MCGQLMKDLETVPAYQDTFGNFTAHENQIVRYSRHDYSSTWCDIGIEQTVIPVDAAKSEGRLSRGRMRNNNSGQKCCVPTFSHQSDVNQRMEEDVTGSTTGILRKHRCHEMPVQLLALKWCQQAFRQ
jgi:hypothetical protein